MDKNKATVTMSLKDYEDLCSQLKYYNQKYKQLADRIKEAVVATVDEDGYMEAINSINKDKLLEIIQDLDEEENC